MMAQRVHGPEPWRDGSSVCMFVSAHHGCFKPAAASL